MILSLPMLWADNLGGWAIANALAGPSAGADFLTISAVITSSLFFVKTALYFHAGGDLEAAGIYFSERFVIVLVHAVYVLAGILDAVA